MPKRGNSVTDLVIELMGGVGNQLFQLSAGLYYSEKGKFKVVLDETQIFGQDAQRRHRISEFLNHKSGIGVKSRIPFVRVCRRISRALRRRSKRYNRILSKLSKVNLAQNIGFEPNLHPSPGKKNILSGYFQSYVYAESLKKNFSKVFTSAPDSRWARDLENQITKEEPICLHLRRGDYWKEASIGVLSVEYYFAALRMMLSQLGEKSIWVFAEHQEDLNEFIQHFPNLRFRLVVSPKDVHPFEVLRIFSKGSGLIIANSTFSWWGAFLAKKCIVVAPSRWFVSQPDPDQLIPPSWLRVASVWSSEKSTT